MILTKSILTIKIITIKILSFVKGDKDSSVVIMDKPDYVIKYQRVMIEEGINNGVYAQTNDTTLKDLRVL